MKIYQRYLLLELLKVFTLFLFSFYFLYVLIDYSSHMKSLHQEGLPFRDVILYYLLQFSSQAEILLPVALAISLIKVITTSNARGEIVALVACGISYKRILRPILAVSLFCALLLYCNFQLITPFAAAKLDQFKNVYLKKNNEKTTTPGHLQLQDGSLLLYGHYDKATSSFQDVFWVINHDLIYRIHTLFPFKEKPQGTHVDLIVRNDHDQLYKKESFDSLSFPKMKFEEKSLFVAVHPPEWQSLSTLTCGHSLSNRTLAKVNDHEARCKTVLLHRLTIPLLSLLALLAIAPSCLKHKRHFSVFLIYAVSLFGLIGFFMLINAAKILGSGQIVAPLSALITPYFICFIFFGYRYATL